MKAFGALLKLNLANSLAILRPASWQDDKGKLRISSIAIAVVSLLGILCLGGAVIAGEYFLFKALSSIGREALLLSLTLIAYLLSGLMLSFFTTYNALYSGRDTHTMAYLPVKERTVFAARLASLYPAEVLWALCILSPAYVLVGVHTHANAWYYIAAFLTALFSPLVTLSVSALLSGLVATLIKRIHAPEQMTAVFSMAALLAFFSVYYSVIFKIEDIDPAQIIMLLLSKQALMDMVASFFPPAGWAVSGVLGQYAMTGLYLLFCAAIAVLVALLFGSHYLQTCLAQQQTAARRTKTDMNRAKLSGRSPLMALVANEWKELLRSNTYLMQCICGVFIMPILFTIMFTVASDQFGEMLDEFPRLFELLSPVDLVLGVCAVMLFGAFAASAAATGVSREGKRHGIMRMWPVSPLTILHAKLIPAMVINALSFVASAAFCMYVFHIPMWMAAAAMPAALLIRFAMDCACLTVDCLHPMLNWQNETQCIKQNMTTALGMLVAILMIVLDGAAYVLLRIFVNLPAAVAVFAVLAIAETIGAYAMLRTAGVKAYSRD